MKKLLDLAVLSLVLIVVALMLAGCGGSSSTPTVPVMVLIPGYGGAIPHESAVAPFNSFTGPDGKYSFSVLQAIGSPTLPPPDARYGINVGQVASADYVYPNDWIRTIVPDSTGLYDLSPPGFYYAVAYQGFETDAAKVAECRVQTGNFPPPSQ